jgi:hypothetical protein
MRGKLQAERGKQRSKMLNSVNEGEITSRKEENKGAKC